jgi:hypothetical protein
MPATLAVVPVTSHIDRAPLASVRRAVGADAPLDLHEEISPGTPGRTHSAVDGTVLWEASKGGAHLDRVGGCKRWPETLWLRSSQGEMVRGRCAAVNLCAYCAMRAAIENTEMLWLDAMHGQAPTLLTVLTTRSTRSDPAAYYKSRELILRDVRARWGPEVQTANLVEFTTGKAARSSNLRRPHFNGMWKGIPDEDHSEASELIVWRWCQREDAMPAGQYVETIKSAGGLSSYLGQHYQKQAQAPPAGWRGHRFSTTRGYFWIPTPQAREAARRSLHLKRATRRAIARGLDAHDAELVAREELAAAAVETWTLVENAPTHPTEHR